LSITNATECGLVYRADEVAALGQLCRARGLTLHMDGARLANAIATTGDSLADTTWRAGVDAVSFGFVKNGGLNAEALIVFRTDLADEVSVRRKRAGHLLSKGRFLAAQILAMLEGDLWLANARAANAAAQKLAAVARDRLVYPVEANELFLGTNPQEVERLRSLDFAFYDWGPGQIRLVTSWDERDDDIERLAAALATL
jgi:threonine aldolase